MSMLGAIAGGDVINILVTMENLSGAGFKNVEKDLGRLGASGKGAFSAHFKRT